MEYEHQIVRGLEVSKLCKTDEVSRQFYFQIFSNNMVAYSDIRKYGNVLDAKERKKIGIKTRHHLSKEFLNTLNADGLKDPIHSSVVIAQCINQSVSSFRKLQTLSEAIGKDCLVTLSPSRGAAGACSSSAEMLGIKLRPSEQSLLPFDDCSHPDQCFCLYRIDPDFGDKIQSNAEKLLAQIREN